MLLKVIIRITFQRLFLNRNNLLLFFYYHVGSESINSNIISIFISNVCENGQLCGLVKKYGRRLRDPICDKICLESLERSPAYVAYHDPLTGNPIGPTFHTLIGESILYSPNGLYPGQNNAYIYKSVSFAIKGSFDQYGLLVKGQKVPYFMSGCDENGLAILEFENPVDPGVFYHYKPASESDFSDQPTVPDELAMEYLEVKPINDFMVKIY